jgi:O-antigen/teichoic acid export membrane protein
MSETQSSQTVAVGAPPHVPDAPSPGAAAPNRHLRTDHLMGDLTGRSVRGGVVTMAAQAVKFFLQIGSTMVLARLLTPVDFGLIAMVTAVTGFVAMFKDAGLSMATVQREDVTQAQVSTLFWINVALSAGVMLVVAALSPLLAYIYSEPRLVWITLALAGTFVFSGLTVQHQALLRRQMRFKHLAYVEIYSLVAGVAVAVFMASRGYGYWSLVGMHFGTAIVNCALVWMYCRWRPGRPERGCGVGSMLRFGGNMLGFNVVNYFTRNADNVLIGVAWGAGPLGVYSKAYALLLLPLKQINVPVAAVTLPAMSRLQNDAHAFREFYCQSVKLLAYVTMPLVILLAVLSREVVLLVLGSQWEDVAPVFMVLAIFGVVQSVSTTTGWVLTALGRADRMLRWSMFFGTPSILIGFAIGLQWGPLGVAIGATTCAMLIVTPQMLYAYHGTPITMRSVLGAVSAPFLLAMSVLAVGAGVKWLLREQHDAVRVLAVLASAGALGGVWLALIPSARQDIRNVVAIVLRRKKSV